MKVRKKVGLLGTEENYCQGVLLSVFLLLKQLLVDVIAKILVPKAANVDTSHLRCAKHLSNEINPGKF